MLDAGIIRVLAVVHRWTGLANALLYLHTRIPADDSRVMLTAVLADAASFHLTRIMHALNNSWSHSLNVSALPRQCLCEVWRRSSR